MYFLEKCKLMEILQTKGLDKLVEETLNQQAQEILKIAEESGVQSNFLFLTTFKRYQVQLDVLSELEKELQENGMVVTKEYVKGRKNVYCSPAVQSYNRTADSANKTVTTLMRIIKIFDVKEKKEEADPLLRVINGTDLNEE